MKKLMTIRKKHSGRSRGKVVVRHQGGAQKRFIRTIDFKRKTSVVGKVVSIEYDPNRTADIALIQYTDGAKSYIIAPHGLKINQKIEAGESVPVAIGNALPLSSIPVGTFVHNIELTAGKGGQMARGAGTFAIVQAKEDKFAHLKLPSGEVRRVRLECIATVGNTSNIDKKNEVVGKAGRNILKGIRPTVRGVAMSPNSHPHGGGEGRVGIGLKYPKTYAGRPSKGNTRNKKKHSSKYIIANRKK